MTLANETPPKDTADLLDRIDREWTALSTLIESLDAEQLARLDPGGWSAADNLAHLAEWERFLIRNQFEGQAPPAALKIEPAVLAKLDEAGINALLLARNQGRPAAEVLADWRQTHARLLAALDALAFADLQVPTRSLGPQAEPAIQWVIYNTYEHYAEHRRTITQNVK
jgi:hypothetical protein